MAELIHKNLSSNSLMVFQLEKYKRMRKINSGAYAEVWEVLDQDTQKLRVMKIVIIQPL